MRGRFAQAGHDTRHDQWIRRRLARANKTAVRLTGEQHLLSAAGINCQAGHDAIRILTNLHRLPGLQRTERFAGPSTCAIA